MKASREEVEKYGSAIGGRVAVVIAEVTSIVKSVRQEIRDVFMSDQTEPKE